MNLAEYESESNPGQMITVSWDGTNIVCSCNYYSSYGSCKHILDYDLSGGGAAVRVLDDSKSSNPQAPPAQQALEADGIDAKEFEKPSTRELAPDIEQAAKEAARKMKGGS